MRKPNMLDKIPRDKLLHFSLGVICFTLFLFISLGIAAIATFIIGIGIEVYQKITKSGVFEWLDAFAFWLGGWFVFIAVFIDRGFIL